jgi:Domain of unknown function (DUF5916)
LPWLALLLCFLALNPRRAFAAADAGFKTHIPSAPDARSRDDVPAPANTRPRALSGSADAVLLTPSAGLLVPRIAAAPVLNDFLANPVRPAAAAMLRIANFTERYPEDGAQPSHATTAYIGYTHNYLYLAFLCRDPQPRQVRAHLMPRDQLGDDDNVQVMLDTFYDQRRAFVFASNPLGIQADALYSEQSGYDFSFDTVWDTWGRRTPWGYAVLMRIPFASLYFAKAAPGQMRNWGIILQRNVAQDSEQDFWPRSQHDIAGRLTQDIEVEGFRDIARGQNIQIEPYALARNLRQLNVVNPIDPYFQAKHLQGYSGLDSKFILHNSLVLDTTLNPDFSQVPVNNPAAPNQRFPPYFPEVRPFFLENSSYFPYNLYYTNNILSPQFGARLTGKLGPWALGVLGVDDRSPGQAVVPGDPQYGQRARFYITRLNRDVGTLSNIGLIYADREYLNSYNRIGGFDYRARVRNRWTFTGQAVTSETRNIGNNTQGEQKCLSRALACSGQGYYDRVSYSDLHHGFWAAYTDTAAGYVTNTGHFQRPDLREFSGDANYIIRPRHGPLLSGGPNLYTERIWDHHGIPLDFYVDPSWNFNFDHRTTFSAGLNLGQDRLRPIDYSALPADVEYQEHTGYVNFSSAPLPYLALGGGFSTGTVINYQPPSNQGPGPVNVTSPSLRLEIKPIRFLDLQNSYVFSHFTTLNNGDLVYDNHQLITHWNYQVNKAVSFNFIGQYIATMPDPQYTNLTSAKTLFADALFTYMPHPGTAFYVGYIGNFANIGRNLCTWQSPGVCNSSEPILAPSGSTLINDGKTVYVKLSYLLRF